MEMLTDEQKDELLEEHKIQWEEIMNRTNQSSANGPPKRHKQKKTPA